MKSEPQIPTAFSPGEVQILDYILRGLIRNSTPHQATRHREFSSLYKKVLAMKEQLVPKGSFRIEHRVKSEPSDLAYIPRIGDCATVFKTREEAEAALTAYKGRFIKSHEEEFDACTQIVEVT